MGAYGVVYRAYDPLLDRAVALKVPHPHRLQSEHDRQRFLREAKAAAKLRHPNIVPLFEAGIDGPRYYMAAAFVEGQTLAARLESHALPVTDAARLVQGLASALDYAHRQGVVHRDVKPANIMLDTQGEPLLMDFGLARLEEGLDKFTHDGTLLGTPAYMPPEQAGARLEEIGPHSDQYSLGVVLYELLCGEAPFSGPPALVISMVLNQEPPRPHARRPDVPKDLETICLKAMSKRADQRYANCGALAEDLRRWSAGEPILARPVRLPERFVRWCWRHPAMAALSMTVTGLLLLVAVVAVVGYVQTSRALTAAKRERERADQSTADALTEKQRAEHQLLQSEWLLYAAQISGAQREWKSGNAATAWHYLNACRTDFRGWEYDYLCALFNQDQHTLKGHTDGVSSVAISADGMRIVSGGWDMTVKVWDATTWKETLTLKGHTDIVSQVAISADGQRIVSGSVDKSVKVWDATTGQVVLTLNGHSDAVSSVAISADGQRIVSGSYDKTVKVWDATTGNETLTLKGHAGGVASVAISVDRQRIVSGGDDKKVKVWNATTGQDLLTLNGNTDGVSSVAISADAQRIVAGSADNVVKVWDVTTRQEILTFKGHADTVSSVAISMDGQRVVSGSSDDTVKVWNATTGEEIFTLKGHTGAVSSVAISADGQLIVSGSADNAVKVWDLTTRQKILTFKGHAGLVRSVASSMAGQRIVSGSSDRIVRVWEGVTGQDVFTLTGHTDGVSSVAISADGERIVSGSHDNTVKVWEGATGREILTLKGHTAGVASVAISADGKRIVSGSHDNTVKVWEGATGREILTLKGHTAGVASVAISADGKRIVSGSHDDTVKVWEGATGREASTLKGHTGGVWSVAISADGRRIVSGSNDKTVKLWDTTTCQELLTLKGNRVLGAMIEKRPPAMTGHTDGVSSVAISADGKRIISGSFDDTLKIWDATTGQEVFTLEGHAGGVWCVAVSADGKQIVSGGGDATVKVWNANQDCVNSGKSEVDVRPSFVRHSETQSPNVNVLRLLSIGGDVVAIIEGTRVQGTAAVVAADKEVRAVEVASRREWTATDTGAVCSFHNVQYLELSETQISDTELPKLTRLTKLEFLGLGAGNHAPRVTFRGLAALKSLSRLKELHLLSLRRNGGTLDVLANFSELAKLTLYKCEVADGDLTHLHGLSKLEELRLCGTQVSDAATKYLASMASLRILHLDGTAITDAALENLAKLERLQELWLDGTRVTIAGVKKLQITLPDCKIVVDPGIQTELDQARTTSRPG